MLHRAADVGRFKEGGERGGSDEEGKPGVARGGDGWDADAADSAGEDGEGEFAGETQACVAGFVVGDWRAGEGEGEKEEEGEEGQEGEGGRGEHGC